MTGGFAYKYLTATNAGDYRIVSVNQRSDTERLINSLRLSPLSRWL